MFCSKCGQKVDEKTGYCTACENEKNILENSADIVTGVQSNLEQNTNAQINNQPTEHIQSHQADASPTPDVSAAVVPKEPEIPETAPARPKKKLSIGRTLASIPVCLLIFIFLFTIIAQFTLKDLVTTDTIENTVKNVDSEIVLNIVEDNFSDIVDTSSANMEIIEELFEQTDIKDEVAKYFADYANAVLTGEELDEISGDDALDILDANERRISRILGRKVSPEHKAALYNFFEDNGEYISQTLVAQASAVPGVVNIITSIYITIALGTIILLLILLLFIIRKWNFGTVLWLGITAIVTSVAFCLVGLLVPGAVIGKFISDPAIYSLVKNLLGSSTLIILKNSLFALLGGIALTGIFALVRTIAKKLAK